MTIRFLFWNLKHLPLQAKVAELVDEHSTTVVILAECAVSISELNSAFAAAKLGVFTESDNPTGETSDLKILYRADVMELRAVFDDPNGHVSIRRLISDSETDLLLVVAHLQSKVNWDGDNQTFAAVRLSRKIQEFERYYAHRRTVLVGDLNMNPFEAGVVASDALHAVMTKRTARGISRVVDAQDCPFFYNPMWRFFGERAGSPPGTHFYAASGKPVAFFWNIFDQVLLRPDVMDKLASVAIVDRVNGVSLLDDHGRPSLHVGSDHLPLVFTIEG